MLSDFKELFYGIPSNPHMRQLLQGFSWLRFEPRLEIEYCQYLGAAAVRQRQVAIVLALLIWLGFVLVDLHRLQPFQQQTSLPMDAQYLLGLRWTVLGLLLLFQLAVMVPRMKFLTLPVTPWVIALSGLATAAINMLYSRLGLPASYDGVILLTIAAFFPLGITFYTSLAAAMSIALGSYLLAFLLLDAAALRSFGLTEIYLLLAVMVIAGGGYLRDHNQREQFLTRHLLSWLAERDGLTGLHNRRSMAHTLEMLQLQGRRDNTQPGLILIDLDHFKAYNDNYGHHTGDQALQRVAATLSSFARRPLDMAVRLGGEEFALLLYGCSETALQQRAEEVLLAIEQLAIEHRSSLTSPVLTASVGLALAAPDELAASLYQRADAALYRAKHAGRNRVCG